MLQTKANDARNLANTDEISKTIAATASSMCDVVGSCSQDAWEQMVDEVAAATVEQNTMQDLAARLHTGLTTDLEVMVFGEGKNGKSTFLNALLDDDLLPSGTVPLTANITRISAARIGEPETAAVHYQGRNYDDVEPIPFGLAGEQGPRLAEKWVSGERAAGDHGDGQPVDRIEIHHHHPILQQGIAISDVPGMNQNEQNDAALMQKRKQCHLLIVICDASKGGFSGEELAQLAAWKQQMKATNIFVVCNKNDAGQGQAVTKPEADRLLRAHVFSHMPAAAMDGLVQTILATTPQPALEAMVSQYMTVDDRPVRDAVVRETKRLFPNAQENLDIHFVSANAALRAMLRGDEAPVEFRVMRDTLFAMLERCVYLFRLVIF
jgi:GTP-binding protein EngB required for normal cell division